MQHVFVAQRIDPILDLLCAYSTCLLGSMSFTVVDVSFQWLDQLQTRYYAPVARRGLQSLRYSECMSLLGILIFIQGN